MSLLWWTFAHCVLQRKVFWSLHSRLLFVIKSPEKSERKRSWASCYFSMPWKFRPFFQPLELLMERRGGRPKNFSFSLKSLQHWLAALTQKVSGLHFKNFSGNGLKRIERLRDIQRHCCAKVPLLFHEPNKNSVDQTGDVDQGNT